MVTWDIGEHPRGVPEPPCTGTSREEPVLHPVDPEWIGLGKSPAFHVLPCSMRNRHSSGSAGRGCGWEAGRRKRLLSAALAGCDCWHPHLMRLSNVCCNPHSERVNSIVPTGCFTRSSSRGCPLVEVMSGKTSAEGCQAPDYLV